MRGIVFMAVAALAAGLCGCGGNAQPNVASVFEAAEKSHPGVPLDAAIAERGVEGFRGFFENVTEESVREKTGGFYAGDVWFNDTLKTLRDRAAVEDYFLKTLKHVDSFRAVVDDHAFSGSNLYVRWTMEVRFKGAKEPVRTIGMTLLRFDKDGRAVMHQDFWDSAAGFYEHLPGVGGLLRWIKSRI